MFAIEALLDCERADVLVDVLELVPDIVGITTSSLISCLGCTTTSDSLTQEAVPPTKARRTSHLIFL